MLDTIKRRSIRRYTGEAVTEIINALLARRWRPIETDSPLGIHRSARTLRDSCPCPPVPDGSQRAGSIRGLWQGGRIGPLSLTVAPLQRICCYRRPAWD